MQVSCGVTHILYQGEQDLLEITETSDPGENRPNAFPTPPNSAGQVQECQASWNLFQHRSNAELAVGAVTYLRLHLIGLQEFPVLENFHSIHLALYLSQVSVSRSLASSTSKSLLI